MDLITPDRAAPSRRQHENPVWSSRSGAGRRQRAPLIHGQALWVGGHRLPPAARVLPGRWAVPGEPVALLCEPRAGMWDWLSRAGSRCCPGPPVWGTVRSVPTCSPPCSGGARGVPVPRNQHCAQHVACSALPAARPKVTSTGDEAVDAEGDLTPAWHPKCPQILHPQAVHLAEQRTVGALGTLTLQRPTVKREGFIITGLKAATRPRDAAEQRGQGREPRVLWGCWDPLQGREEGNQRG